MKVNYELDGYGEKLPGCAISIHAWHVVFGGQM